MAKKSKADDVLVYTPATEKNLVPAAEKLLKRALGAPGTQQHEDDLAELETLDRDLADGIAAGVIYSPTDDPLARQVRAADNRAKLRDLVNRTFYRMSSNGEYVLDKVKMMAFAVAGVSLTGIVAYLLMNGATADQTSTGLASMLPSSSSTPSKTKVTLGGAGGVSDLAPPVTVKKAAPISLNAPNTARYNAVPTTGSGQGSRSASSVAPESNVYASPSASRDYASGVRSSMSGSAASGGGSRNATGFVAPTSAVSPSTSGGPKPSPDAVSKPVARSGSATQPGGLSPYGSAAGFEPGGLPTDRADNTTSVAGSGAQEGNSITTASTRTPVLNSRPPTLNAGAGSTGGSTTTPSSSQTAAANPSAGAANPSDGKSRASGTPYATPLTRSPTASSVTTTAKPSPIVSSEPQPSTASSSSGAAARGGGVVLSGTAARGSGDSVGVRTPETTGLIMYGSGSSAKPGSAPEAPAGGSFSLYRQPDTVNVGSAPAQSSVNPAQNGSPAAAQPSESIFPIGTRFDARLVTSVIAVEQGLSPLIAQTDGDWCGKGQCPMLTWIGSAKLAPDRRVAFNLESLVIGQTLYSVKGQALSPSDFGPGLIAQISDETPTLVQDLLRGAIGSASDWLNTSISATTTTQLPGGGTSQSQSTPSLESFFLGRVAGLFSLPEGTRAVIRTARVSVGTPIKILFGVPPLNYGTPTQP